MEKIIELKTTDKMFYSHYLQLLSGVSGLSQKETALLAELLDHTYEVSDNVEMSDAYENNKILIKRFKDKQILVFNGEHFEINQSLYVPRENINVTFKLRRV